MLSYRLGTVNDFHWELKPVLSYSKPQWLRHLGTFVNASHNWYTVSPLPKSWWHITMNCLGEVIRQLHAYVLNLLFSWKFEHKCGFGDLFTFCNTFNVLCTCNEGHHFYLNDMQTNYVMEYLTDYNENAKIIKIKFVYF